MSELGDKQKLFCRLLPKLFNHAFSLGYEITIGDAYRDPRLHGMIGVKKGYGHRNSNHKRRLAIDLNLFKDGEYLDMSEDYRPLAEYWKSLHPDCKAGIDFNDGNHFSIGYRGQS